MTDTPPDPDANPEDDGAPRPAVPVGPRGTGDETGDPDSDNP